MLKNKKDYNYKEMVMWSLFIYCDERNREVECLSRNKCKGCEIASAKVKVIMDMNSDEVESYVFRCLEIIDKGKDNA